MGVHRFGEQLAGGAAIVRGRPSPAGTAAPHPRPPAWRALPRVATTLALPAAALALAGCALAPAPPASPGPALLALTLDNALLRIDAHQPGQVRQRVPLSGLPDGESLVGMDFRVAQGVLYGLTSGGRLVTVDTATGTLKPVGDAPPAALQGRRFGMDFNPAADRVRVVSDSGQNLRLHPDTGAVAATDPPLSAGTDGAPAPRLAGAAYTYNKTDEKLTTNYAIDIGRGWLVTQGSVEGRTPAVSPNTGRVFDVGALGTGALEDAAFDITDTDNTALAALRAGGRTRLVRIDLSTGRAMSLGLLADGGAIRALAIEP